MDEHHEHHHGKKDTEALRAQLKLQMAAIPHKVLVMSGKGGVGKTTVAVNLAFAFAAEGLRVGILDVDLHGPNAALMAGVEGRRLAQIPNCLMPVSASPNVRVLSMSALLPDADTAIIWRGPMKMGIIEHFLAEGDWSGTDVLVVDCPPGTGDEPLSVAQLLPEADGVVIVTSPQAVAVLDSRKCVQFVRQVGLPVLGLVENLSGFCCPDCGRRVDLFRSGGGEHAAEALGVPFLGRVPITPAVVEQCDAGAPIVVACPTDPAAVALRAVAAALLPRLQGARRSPPPAPRPGHQLVAVAADDERGLEGTVAAHFGRCPSYVLVDVEGGSVSGVRVVANPHADAHGPAVVLDHLRDLGVQVIIAGSLGACAQDLLGRFGIEAVPGQTGRVEDAVTAYLRAHAGATAG
jgi:ATP-binding protein involved in chromosome partitioning